MPHGQIIKSISGYFYVLPTNNNLNHGDLIQCRGKGSLRRKQLVPLVGDYVDFEYSNHREGTVIEILPRINHLVRPPISNIELAVLVSSVEEPLLSLQLIDKYLVMLEKAKIPCLICLTKYDLIEKKSGSTDHNIKLLDSSIEEIIRVYENIGYEVTYSSLENQEQVVRLVSRLQNKISVFFGQSGVGKSTLLNRMIDNLKIETSEISQKLGRGKHTTRHVELYPLELGGYIADTPGFSQLDLVDIEIEELDYYFKEFVELRNHCKFRGCTHTIEPGCQVRHSLLEGKIAKSRYNHYLTFFQEIKDRKKRY